jgi:hypothetical protein
VAAAPRGSKGTKWSAAIAAGGPIDVRINQIFMFAAKRIGSERKTTYR